MSEFMADYRKNIQDWLEISIREFNNPDPNKQLKIKLEKKRVKKKNKLKTHYGL